MRSPEGLSDHPRDTQPRSATPETVVVAPITSAPPGVQNSTTRGRAFHSWLARLAAQNGLSSSQFLATTGGLSRIYQLDLDVEPPIGLLERLAGATDLDRCDIERMCVTVRTSASGSYRWDLLFRPKVRQGLQLCPECFSSKQPYYRRAWRLSWYVACPDHYRLLLDRCRCGAALGPLVSRVERINGVADFYLCRSCRTDVRTLGGAGPVNLIALGDVLALQKACAGNDERILQRVESSLRAFCRDVRRHYCGEMVRDRRVLTAIARTTSHEMGFVRQPAAQDFPYWYCRVLASGWPKSVRSAFAGVRLTSEDVESYLTS